MSNPPKNPPGRPDNETNSQLEPLEVQIERQIGDLVPKKSRDEIIRRVTTTVYSEAFSGPIAHPRHLREYENIHPGSADRIISMAEASAAHNRSIDNQLLAAEVADRKLGMLLGASCLALLLILAFASAVLTGSEVVPGLFLGSAVLGAVGMFIKGRHNGS